MLLIKINSNNEIIECPYQGTEYRQIMDDPSLLANTAWLPDNIALVDIKSHKPQTVHWDQYPQANSYPSYNESENTWYLTYRMVDKYETPEKKLNAIKTRKLEYASSIENAFKQSSIKLRKTYLPQERETFPVQRKEAEAFQANNAVETPMLTAIAAKREITVSELSQKVLDKAIAMDIEYGTIVGRYYKNKEILNTIDFDDETTWSNIENIEF